MRWPRGTAQMRSAAPRQRQGDVLCIPS
jgi:hypothetical protein